MRPDALGISVVALGRALRGDGDVLAFLSDTYKQSTEVREKKIAKTGRSRRRHEGAIDFDIEPATSNLRGGHSCNARSQVALLQLEGIFQKFRENLFVTVAQGSDPPPLGGEFSSRGG
jgi:hypothetical protein